MDVIKGWLWETDSELRFTYLTESVRKHAGRAPEWHYGKTRAEVGNIDPASALWQNHLRKLQLRQPFDPFEFKRHQDGQWFWMRTFGRPTFDAEGKFCGYRGVAFDITAEKEAQEALADTKRFLDSVVENAPVAILVKDPVSRQILLANQAYEQLVGLSRDKIVGKTAFQIFDKDTADLFDKYDNDALRSDDKIVARDIVVETPGRGVRVSTATRMVVRDNKGHPKYLIIAVEDITERKSAEQRIAFLAYHDALTDLPNRVLLRERLKDALARANRGAYRVAVLMLDLDRFKEVNDTLGHAMGDELLKAVAERLRSCVRESATIARLGGDEFAIVEDVVDGAVEVSALAERIQMALSSAFDLGEHRTVIGSSIGIAIAPRDGTCPDELLKNADLALYRAKSDGRGTHRFFEPEMNELIQARRELERDLRDALACSQFELHYQPVVDLQSGKVSGCEALLRWHHPKRGMVHPADFVPLAEETGLIASIGEWVLRKACADAATWPDHLKIAVNISPAQFKCLVPVVLGVLASSGLAPQRLELEITESVIMLDSEATFATLRKLHDLGIGIALDDFGTGLSSLSFLRRFAFDKIKIDRSFVNDLTDTADASRAIVRSLIQLATSLGRTTTAEGVETKELLEIVRAEGCTEAQGYYFSRAIPASELAALLQGQVGNPARAA